MTYPRVAASSVFAGAFLGGVASAAIIGSWAITVALALGLVLALRLVDRPSHRTAVFVAVALLALLGHTRFASAGGGAASLPPGALGTHEVVGTIRDDPRVRGIYARVDLELEELDRRPIDGAVRITLTAPLDPLEAGERLRMVVDLEEPPEIEAFDYPAFLASRGISAVGGFPDRWERIGQSGDWRAPLRALRREMNANIERVIPAPESSLAAGVLVGERGAMPPDLTEALRRTGTTHLVVVSGQNVAMLLGFGVALLTLVVSRRRASLALLALLFPYVAFVGADPPVVRAAVMAVGIVIAGAMGRRTPGWIYLVYAAALMVAWSPSLANDVAFQLSGTATAGVMVVAPTLKHAMLARLRWPDSGGRAALVEMVATALGATLAVLPVQVAAFERVSLIAVPANVAVAPLYAGTLLAAFLAALAGATEVTTTAARPVLELLPSAFIWTVERFDQVPGGEFAVRAPLAAGLAWYVGLAAVTWLFDRRTERPAALELAQHGAFSWTAGLAVVAIGLWLAVLQPTREDARVTFLDVGQGLAVLIEDGGTSVLFDAGPPDGSVVLALPSEVGDLDAVIVSHTDADHAGGLVPVLGRLSVGALLAEERTGSALRAELPEARAIRPLDIGDRIHLSERTTIEVLSPPTVSRGAAHESDNDGSLVVLVTIGERRILVTADIEEAAESWLLETGTSLQADVLLVPHQGSKTSSTPAFLDAVAPAAAVLSVGAGNSYGHPAEEVIARYEGVPLFRTDEDGTVTVTSDGEQLWIRTAR